MAGLAGPTIGTNAFNAIPIGGVTRATADGGTSGRGGLENFIGFGKGLSSLEPKPQDFNITDDTNHICATGNAAYTPLYTPTVPASTSEVLSWLTA